MRKLIFILIALISFSQAQTVQYIGAPTTTVISRGNFRTDSIFYLPKRTKLPTDTAAFRYQISDSSLYYWTGYQWTKVGNNQDTASMLSNYVRGSGTINYIPKFNSTRSVVDSKLYESNLNLLFNSITPYLTTSGISTIENNGTSAALYVLKTLDTARAYVSFGGANTMDINNLRAGDIRFYTNATLRGRFQTDGTFRLNSLTGTGSRIVVADANGVLSATSSATGLVDTTLLSTRAWRQKGDDSLGAIIATKGSGTVTSVATGYGLSGGTINTTGTLIADTALVASRLRLSKVADSLSLVKQNVLTNPVTGTGITNYLPKFTGTSTIGNSSIIDNGSQIITNLNDIRFGNAVSTADVSLKLGRTRTNNGFVFIDLIGDTTYSDYGLRFIRGNTGLNATSSLEHRGTGTFTINANESANVRINTSATERFTILSTGNIGIGNTNPTSILTVGSNNSASTTPTSIEMDRSYRTGGSAFDKLKFYLYKDGSQSYGFGLGDLADVQYWAGSSSTGMHRFFTSQTERVRLTSSGELLINTTTDAGAYTLQNNGALYNTGSAILAATSGEVLIRGTNNPLADVNRGNITLNGTLSNIVAFTNGSSATGYLFQSTTDMQLFNATATGNLRFFTNGTEYIRLRPDGECLFGTTTDAGNYRVQVSGNAYVSGNMAITGDATANGLTIAKPSSQGSEISLRGNNNSASTEFLLAQANDGNTTYIYNRANGRMYFGTNNTARLLIRSDGELLVNTETDNGAYILQLNGDMYTNGTITTGAPTDGTAAPFKIGSYVTTAPSATGFIQVQINGVKYKLLAATY